MNQANQADKIDDSAVQDTWLTKFMNSKDKFQVKTVQVDAPYSDAQALELFGKRAPDILATTGHKVQERKTLRCSFHHTRGQQKLQASQGPDSDPVIQNYFASSSPDANVGVGVGLKSSPAPEAKGGHGGGTLPPKVRKYTLYAHANI